MSTCRTQIYDFFLVKIKKKKPRKITIKLKKMFWGKIYIILDTEKMHLLFLSSEKDLRIIYDV